MTAMGHHLLHARRLAGHARATSSSVRGAPFVAAVWLDMKWAVATGNAVGMYLRFLMPSQAGDKICAFKKSAAAPAAGPSKSLQYLMNSEISRL
jgi:hypothetical protein